MSDASDSSSHVLSATERDGLRVGNVSSSSTPLMPLDSSPLSSTVDGGDEGVDNGDDSSTEEEDNTSFFSRISYRAATPDDVDALRELFDGALSKPYPTSFYDDLRVGLSTAIATATSTSTSTATATSTSTSTATATTPTTPTTPAPAADMRLSAHLVDDSGFLAGAVVIASMPLAVAKKSGRLPTDIIEDEIETAAATTAVTRTTAACVLIIAIGERYRRMGLGTNLLTAGLAQVALPDPSLKAAFLHSRASDQGSAAFYEANDFTPLGALPNYYTGDSPLTTAGNSQRQGQTLREDALLWVRPLRSAVLIDYEGGAKNPRTAAGHVDLTHPALKRTAKMPWWLRDIFFHFLLPALAVCVLFALCSLLVWLGPLKGISGSGGGGPGAGVGKNNDL